MLYLTVGTNEITQELSIPIKDREEGIYKPSGGLWLTKYDPKYENYNEWVDYLIDNPNVFFFKNKSNDIWHQPCSVVGLTSNAKIFYLNNEEDYNFLMNNYPLNNKCFSYELLSKDYDGIFVNILSLINNNNKNIINLIKQYCVSTLLLFNLDCIEYYQKGIVNIEPFDMESFEYEATFYQISYEDTKKRIKCK